MQNRILLLLILITGLYSIKSIAQPVTCPAPVPTSADCYQTNRGTTFGGLTTPLWEKAPNPNQDCCNATPLCASVNTIENGTVMPPHPNGANTNWTTPWFPGCVRDELPIDANTCFSNNEKGTTWYKFKIRPLPGGPTANGSPAGKLRFRIIPQDAFDDPDYDPDGEDLGAIGYGNTDYDFLLFDVTAACTDGDQCRIIKNSTTFTNPTSVIKSCNWTGTRGPTGLFEPGTGSEMSTGTAARFNKPLDVKVGQVFILAIDNFSAGIQGFTVDFNPNSTITAAMGPTAIVVPPPLTDSIRIKSVSNPNCEKEEITITFSSPVRTDSLAASSFVVLGQNPPYTLTPKVNITNCFGVEDTTFTFTISPSVPDTTLRLVLVNEIRDICGNKVLLDTIPFRIPYLKNSIYSIAQIQPSCGTKKINIRLDKKVLCDSISGNISNILETGNLTKFKIRPRGDTSNINIVEIFPTDTLWVRKPCMPGRLDSLFQFTLSKEIIDTTDFDIFIDLVNAKRITDSCGARLDSGNIPFRISPIRIPFSFAAVQPQCDITKFNIRLDSNVLVKYMTDTLTRNRFRIVNPTDTTKFCDIVKIESTRNQGNNTLDSLFTFTLSKELIDTTNLALYIVNDSAGKIKNDCKSYLKAGFVPFQIAPIRVPFQISPTQPFCDINKISIRLDSTVLVGTMTDTLTRKRFAIVNPTDSSKFCDIVNIESTRGRANNQLDSLFTFTLSNQVIDSTNLAIYIVNDSAGKIRNNCKRFLKAGFVPFKIIPKKITYQIINSPNCGDAKIDVAFSKKVSCDSVIKSGKFTVRIKDTVQTISIVKPSRISGTCPADGLDSLFSINLASIKISSDYSISIDQGSIIRDKCGNPAFFASKAFSVKPFLKIIGVEDTVCPDKSVRLQVSLDSNYYRGRNLQNLQYTWRETGSADTLLSKIGAVVFDGPDGALRSTIELNRTVLAPTPVKYTLTVKSKTNGCKDMDTIAVLFSPIPDVTAIDNRVACFGETISVRPGVTNGLLSSFDYKWTRIANPATANKLLSTDSILSLVNTDSLSTFGLNQKYQLEIAFKQSMGGCKAAQAYPFDLILGKRIEAKIGLIPDDSVASILPADFTFSNLTKFTPIKNTPKFNWSFGVENSNREIFGYNNQNFRYNEPGKFQIKLTAYDTLYNSSNFAKLCSNSDSVEIFTQNLVPSLVTSNNDGKNDFLSIQGMRPNTFSMKLYNRWGKLVGEQDPFDANVGWDPKDVGPGNYYYILTEKRSGKTIVSWLTISKD